LLLSIYVKSDEELAHLLEQRLRRIRELLSEIRDLLVAAAGVG